MVFRRLRRVFLVLATCLVTITALVSPAGAATTSKPWTIPALKQWTSASGSFVFTPATRVVVDDPALAATAATFAADLTDLAGHPIRVAVGAARPHDIELKLDRTVTPAAEGYTLTVGAGTVIAGATDTGVFWGTRSILQMLHQNATLPGGVAHDWPDYSYRGITVCNCVTFESVPWLERLIKDMSYLKYDELHLEMRVASSAHPENNSTTTPVYTPAQVAEITQFGQRYHVQVMQQVSSPSHSDYYLAAHPELQLKDANGVADPSAVDMASPNALPYIESLDKEQMPEFPGTDWYGGGDEIFDGTAPYANYPSLVDWVHEQAGPTAPAADSWVLWQNEINQFVTAQHRTLHVWNDQMYEGMPTKLDKNVVVDYWIHQTGRMTPAEVVANGNDVVNESDSLYYVNSAPGAQWIYETFTPNLFTGGLTIPAADPHLLGTAMAIWPSAHGLSEASYEQGLYDPLRALAQKNWGGTPLVPTYAEFAPIIDAIGHAPGYQRSGLLPANTVYTLQGADGRYAGVTGAGALTGSAVASGPAGRWLLTEDSAALYTLVSAADGRCLATADDSYTENAPLVTTDCDSTKTNQKWLLEKGSGGSYVLRNSSSGRVLAEPASGDGLVQQYGPVSRSQQWALKPAADQVTAISTVASAVVPSGGSTTDSTVITNWGSTTVSAVEAKLTVPSGVSATATTPTSIASLAPGASATVTWTVGLGSLSTTGYLPVRATLSTGAGATASILGTAAGLAGARAYVANFTSYTVTPVDLASQTAGATIPTGTLPGTIAASPDGKTVYVANQGGNSVTVIDTASNTVTATIPVGATPAGLAFAPDGTTLWVTDYSDNAIQPIDVATGKAGAEIAVGTGPEDLVVSPDGSTVWAACRQSNQVVGVDIATGKATTTLAVSGGPDGIDITPDGKTLYVGQENSTTVTPIATATGTLGSPITVGSSPFNLKVSPDGKTVAVPVNGGYTVALISTATNSVSSQVTVGNAPAAVNFSKDGSIVYATVTGNNTIVPILLASGQVGPSVPTGGYPIGVAITG